MDLSCGGMPSSTICSRTKYCRLENSTNGDQCLSELLKACVTAYATVTGPQHRPATILRAKRSAYFLDRMSILCPPALKIAAVEPVAVDTL
jgi:hypothetical protein